MNYKSGTFTLSPSSGDMSQATVTAAAALNGPGDVRHLRFVGIQAVFTGAPVGSLQLYVSADNTTWTPAGAAVAVSVAGNAAWDIIDTGFLWVKVVYTKTSGTGTLTVNFSGKGD